jgi:hypothetical protein
MAFIVGPDGAAKLFTLKTEYVEYRRGKTGLHSPPLPYAGAVVAEPGRL